MSGNLKISKTQLGYANIPERIYVPGEQLCTVLMSH